jgi:gluconokinase
MLHSRASIERVQAMNNQVLLLMGVSGSGKSTVGALLAGKLNWPYADADSFHSAANVAKMAAGHPLTDEDRGPWLHAIRAWIDERVRDGAPGVVTCSALKRAYRDVLRAPGSTMVYLHGTRAQIQQRMVARQGHFFKLDMLDSQFAALQEPTPEEHVITVPIGGTPTEIVDAILAAISADRGVAR